MNEPDNRAELEARVTALLLGELSAEEAAALRQTISQDAALAKLHERLRLTLDLLRATAATSAGALSEQPAPLKLSPRRREMLLAHFKTVSPKELARPRGRKVSFLVEMAAAAAILIVAAGLLFPKLGGVGATAKSGFLGRKTPGRSYTMDFAEVPRTDGRHGTNGTDRTDGVRASGRVAMANGTLASDVNPSRAASAPASPRKSSIYVGKGVQGGESIDLDTFGTEVSGGAEERAGNLIVSGGSVPPSEAKPASPPKSSIYVGKTEESGKPGSANQGLTLNLRNVSVDQALSSLAESEGLSVYRRASTAFAGTVDMVSQTPLNKDETVGLLNKVLADHNLTAVRDGNTLSVMSTQQAVDSGVMPITVSGIPAGTEADSEMVTENIPLHSLNPAEVSRDMNPLLPPGAKMSTSDAGNSIIMTGKQADIKRMAQTISALDSTGNGNLQAFLNEAKSKQVASEFKDVFADTGASGAASGGFNVATIMGSRGGAGAASNENTQRTTFRVNRVGGFAPAPAAAPAAAPDPAVVARLQAERATGNGSYATQGQTGQVTFSAEPITGDITYITSGAHQAEIETAAEALHRPLPQNLANARMDYGIPLNQDRNNPNIQGGVISGSGQLVSGTYGEGQDVFAGSFVSGAGALSLAPVSPAAAESDQRVPYHLADVPNATAYTATTNGGVYSFNGVDANWSDKLHSAGNQNGPGNVVIKNGSVIGGAGVGQSNVFYRYVDENNVVHYPGGVVQDLTRTNGAVSGRSDSGVVEGFGGGGGFGGHGGDSITFTDGNSSSRLVGVPIYRNTNSISGLDGVSPYREVGGLAARKAEGMGANDIVVTRRFVLTNAESTDVASALRGLGGGSGASVGKFSPALSAVPEARTQTVTVTASKDTMDMDAIGKIVGEMDKQPEGQKQVFAYQGQNSDVLDRIEPLTEVFPQQNGRTSSGSSQQNPLTQRAQQSATQSTASARTYIELARTEGMEGTKGTTQTTATAHTTVGPDDGVHTIFDIGDELAGFNTLVGARAVAGGGSGRGGRGGGGGGAGGPGGGGTGTNGNFALPYITQLGDPLQPAAPGMNLGTPGTVEVAKRLARPEARNVAGVVGLVTSVSANTAELPGSDEAVGTLTVGADGRIAGNQTHSLPSDAGKVFAGAVEGFVDSSAGGWQLWAGEKITGTNSLAAADRNSGAVDSVSFNLLEGLSGEASKAKDAAAGGGFNGLYWPNAAAAAGRERNGGEPRNVAGIVDLDDLYAATANGDGALAPNEATVNVWNNAGGTVTLSEEGITGGRKEQESARAKNLAAVIDRRYSGEKSQDAGEAKKSGSILGEIPIIGGLFRSKEAPAAAAAVPTNYAMGNNFTPQIYASPPPASGRVRGTNGPALGFATSGLGEPASVTTLAGKSAEANKAKATAAKPVAALTPQTHALDAVAANATAAKRLPAASAAGATNAVITRRLAPSTNAAGRGLPALPSAIAATERPDTGSQGSIEHRFLSSNNNNIIGARRDVFVPAETPPTNVDIIRTRYSFRKADAPPPKPASPPPVPQAEVQTRDNAFSTFSLNVSDVSFRLAAASLEKGLLPDASTVRSEEFINAFNYRDSEPAPGAPIGFAWERAGYPFAHNRDLLRFAVKAASEGRQADRALNLVLLLDKSGSMERADRVAIIREALRVLGAQLKAQDTVSVVLFARTARLFADAVPGSRFAALAAELESLTPEGGTNLEEAMRLAYETVLRHYLANGENRVVLLTDGAANLGDVEPGDLKKKVEAYRAQGIALDCFGVGWEDYNDNLLEVLSRSGGGRYGFVNTPEEAATGFAGQLAGALRVAASDVKVQVEFNPERVISYRQIGYAKDQLKKEEFRDNSVKAAQISVAESGNALYTVELNPAGSGPICTVYVRYRTPGTSDYYEHAWPVPYTGAADPLDKASPPMRLAATASAFAEWLAGSPYAGEVTLNKLQGYLRGVPEFYGADARPKLLETMLGEAGR